VLSLEIVSSVWTKQEEVVVVAKYIFALLEFLRAANDPELRSVVLGRLDLNVSVLTTVPTCNNEIGTGGVFRTVGRASIP